MNRSGIVMDVKNNKACLMTSGGEFINVKYRGLKPGVGQIFEGEQISKVPFYRYSLTAASIILLMFFGNLAYAYNTPVASILVKINPNMELKINKWDKIIKTTPLNKDGKLVLSSLKLRNKSLDEGLNLIVEEAKKENFINQDYISSGKEITISIKDKRGNRIVDISKFINNAAKKKLKVRVILKDNRPDNNKVKGKAEDRILKPIKNIKNNETKAKNPIEQDNNNNRFQNNYKNSKSHNENKKDKSDKDRRHSNKKERSKYLQKKINNFGNEKIKSRGDHEENYGDNDNNKS